MGTPNLGRLERVDLREIWASEAENFTPWLAREENLKLLGDTIGMELELEAQEKDVGPFRADILCKDAGTGAWVLIENQLERTDHTHLGQLLTYAAGLKVVTIVWIAQRFTEEHRAALDWLNEITDDRFQFFGLEVELWKIGNSAIAPKFNIVCKPNDWTKDVTRGASQIDAAELTEAKRLQLDFWTAFRAYVLGQDTPIKPTKPLPQYWMNISLGRTGFKLAAVASFWDSASHSYGTNELRAEVILYSEDSKQHFEQLEAMKAILEQEVGESLLWYNPEKGRTCTIYLRRSADLNDRDCWPEYRQWLLTKLELLHRVFGNRIKQLPSGGAVREEKAEA